MKVFEKTITLEDKKEPLCIVPFSDVHIGASGVNKSYFEKTIDWIKNKQNCYAIGVGDYVDAINIKDKRFDIKSIDKTFLKDLDNLPLAQMDYIIKKLRPIRHKILLLIPGNHEEKFRINNSVDIMREIEKDLKVPCGDYMSFLRIKFDKQQFRYGIIPINIWLNHGWFQGRKLGGKANQLMDVANTYQASIYIAGHSHDLFATTLEQMSLADRSLEIIKHKKIFINSGTFLETVTKQGTSYGEMKSYPVAKVGTARLDIYPRKSPKMSDIHVRI